MSVLSTHDLTRIHEASVSAHDGACEALGGPLRELGDFKEAAHAMAVAYGDLLAMCLFLAQSEQEASDMADALREACEASCKYTLSALHRHTSAGSA